MALPAPKPGNLPLCVLPALGETEKPRCLLKLGELDARLHPSCLAGDREHLLPCSRAGVVGDIPVAIRVPP